MQVDAMDGIELVIFDMAGTTVKEQGQVAAAFMSALSERDIRVTPEQLNAVRGSSKREAVLRFIPETADREKMAAQVYASFREHLARLYGAGRVEPVEGAEEMFCWLRGRGIGVALNTGFDRDITELLLAMLGWKEGVVDAVVCGDDVRCGRPAPYLIFRAMEAAGANSPRRVVNVGDTVLDLQAGHNACAVWNVGVLSGAHGRRQLERAPHTHLIESVASLRDLWPAE